MLVTPGTAKVHGAGRARSRAGRAAPSRRCTRRRGTARRRAAAAAAIGATGSMTPWAYDGADATTSTVPSSMAAAIGLGVGALRRRDRRRRGPARRRSSARPCGRPRAPSSAAPSGGAGDLGPRVTGGLDGEQDRLGAARRDDAGDPAGAVDEQARRCRRGRSPSAAGTGKPSGRGRSSTRMPRGPRGRSRPPSGQAGVVDVGEGAAAVGRQVAGRSSVEPSRRRSRILRSWSIGWSPSSRVERGRPRQPEETESATGPRHQREAERDRRQGGVRLRHGRSRSRTRSRREPARGHTIAGPSASPSVSPAVHTPVKTPTRGARRPVRAARDVRRASRAGTSARRRTRRRRRRSAA